MEDSSMASEKKKIYIVDDDESVCQALRTLLKTFDFEVRTFNSADSFFDAVPNDEPGCLVLDIHMPGIDGWNMQKKIFDSGSKRPVIFISAEKQDNAADRALKVGAVGFLQKPFNGQSLVDLIHAASKDTRDTTNSEVRASPHRPT
jgi:two-component system, LuxR family, response regulator FixJ